MNIFIDESGTSGSVFDNSNTLMAASYYVQDRDLEATVKRLLKGKELKGTDLMTKDMNEALSYIKNSILSKVVGGVFIFEARANYARQRLYDIFYPWEVLSDTSIEILRNKIAFSTYEYDYSFLRDSYNISNFRAYRLEVIKVAESDKNFSKDEIESLKKYFKKQVKLGVRVERESHHSSVILDAMGRSIIEFKSAGQLHFIIDDFTNKIEKENIESSFKVFQAKEPSVKLSYEFADSKDRIGLQIADWLVSIPRKAVKSVLDVFEKGTKSDGTYSIKEKNKDFLKFNAGIISWIRTIFLNIQVSPKKQAILYIVEERLRDVFSDELINKLIYKKAAAVIKWELENLGPQIEVFKRDIANFDSLDYMNKLDLNNPNDLDFFEGVLEESLK